MLLQVCRQGILHFHFAVYVNLWSPSIFNTSNWTYKNWMKVKSKCLLILMGFTGVKLLWVMLHRRVYWLLNNQPQQVSWSLCTFLLYTEWEGLCMPPSWAALDEVGLSFTELSLMNWHPSVLGTCLERIQSEQPCGGCPLQQFLR